MPTDPSLIARLAAALLIVVIYAASPARRSLRSVLFLSMTGIAWLAVSVFAEPMHQPIIGLAAVAIWLLGLWDLNHLLAPFAPDEVRFDQRLGSIRRGVLNHESTSRWRIGTASAPATSQSWSQRWPRLASCSLRRLNGIA